MGVEAAEAVCLLRELLEGERRCPDGVAARLHWLALLIDQLECTSNAFGILRWIQLARAALDGKAPQDRLKSFPRPVFS